MPCKARALGKEISTSPKTSIEGTMAHRAAMNRGIIAKEVLTKSRLKSSPATGNGIRHLCASCGFSFSGRLAPHAAGDHK